MNDSNLEFKELTTKEISDFFVKDPKLSYMALNDEDLVHIYETGEYMCYPGSHYIGITEDNVLKCVFKWEYFSAIAVSIHPYIASEHQKQGLLTRVYHFVGKHFKENTHVKKVTIFIPSPCEHVWRHCDKHGFIREGCLTKSTIWRKELADIYLYTINITDIKEVI